MDEKKRAFNLKGLTDKMLRDIRVRAALRGESSSEWIRNTLYERIEREPITVQFSENH